MVQNEPPEATATPAWLAVAAVAFGTFVAVTTEFLPVGLLSEIRADLHVSAGTAGWMVTVPGLVAAVVAPLLLTSAGRLDRRHVMIGLTGLVAASNAVALVAPTWPVMLLARVLLGVSVGGLWAVAPSLALRLVAERDVPRATAVVLGGISLGTVVGLPAGTLLGGLAGWRTAFGVTGALAVAGLLLQARLLPSLPSLRGLRIAQVAALLRRPPVRLALAVTAVGFAGQFAAYTFVEPFLREETGTSSGALSALLLVYGAAGIAGNALASGQAPRHPGRTLALAAGAMALAAGLFPVVARTDLAGAVLLAVWGLGIGAFPLCVQLRMFGATPDAPEGGAALLVSAVQVSLATGALGGGVVVDAVGTSATMWLGAGLVALVVALVAAPRLAVRAVPLGVRGA